MTLLKRCFVFIIYYAMAFLIANLTVGVLSLIFKIFLVTVQGPTMVTRILAIAIFYISFSIASFFLFRKYGKKQQPIKYREIVIFFSLIILLHFIIIFFGEWNTVWTVTTGTIELVGMMYSGGGHIESYRDIPRLYYYVALTIGDICFVIFSSIGVLRGKRIKKLT
jgi:hypothetical protein